MKKVFAAAACLGIATFVAPLAQADQWNKRTILTVNEAIQVPGAVLQPGKYVMKLAESPANRHIVQIFNEREDQIMTTILAIPNYRLQPTGETQFGWWEVPAGQPRALRAWFYPGDNFGQEFAYPKTAAVQIATANNTNVPTIAENESNLATAHVGTVDRAGTEMELDRQTYSAADQSNNQNDMNAAAQQPAEQPAAQQQETQQETMVAQNRTTPSGMNQGAAQDTTGADMAETRTRNRLPDTASPFPLIGVAGFAALGASIVARKLASRS